MGSGKIENSSKANTAEGLKQIQLQAASYTLQADTSKAKYS
jgi:hypothetical protein